jgi:hypothetical protein
MVSYVGASDWLGKGARADCVVFRKGAACMPSIKHVITIHERNFTEKNILRWETSQVDGEHGEGILEALTASDKTPYAATPHH